MANIPIQYNIKWNRKDYITLGKAVAQFNKKIRELNKEEVKTYLPETINYYDIKETILTRRGLKNTINSLKRFSKEGAEQLYKTKSGEEITKWEYKELVINKRNALRRLNQELNELNIKGETGFSRAEMGSQRVHEIQSTINSIKNFENKKGYDFIREAKRINLLGNYDYLMKKSITYQDNFMYELYNLKRNNPEFEKVFNYFNNIKNPIEFFNVTKRSNIMQDFFVWYAKPEDYAEFKTDNEVAEYIIEQYQIKE